jgi:hypothetical protein
MDENTRNGIAESLVNLADQDDWNGDAWQRCFRLIEANHEDELLRYVYDDLIHYSGIFHEYNLLGIRTKPDKVVLENYRQEFRDIATALRTGLSLSEAQQKYGL